MAELARVLEDGGAVPLDVIIELKSIASFHDELRKPLLSINERTLSQILAIEFEEIERYERRLPIVFPLSGSGRSSACRSGRRRCPRRRAGPTSP
jgi:hypothetical protein